MSHEGVSMTGCCGNSADNILQSHSDWKSCKLT